MQSYEVPLCLLQHAEGIETHSYDVFDREARELKLEG
jgi:hypothetical protein